MLHEDRILRSIDLLTSNARETLNKYVEWARTSKSDVTFNLFDALPSYKDNGSTGSGAYIKPITIPSFSSISNGIFGETATDSERDINWNFNFIANGKGWNFDEYIPTTGATAKNQTPPKLSINVDTEFGPRKSGANSNVSFKGVNVKYVSTNSELNLSDSGISFKVNLLNSFATKSVINGEDILIGSNYSLFAGLTSTRGGFPEKTSNSVTITSNKISVFNKDGNILTTEVNSDEITIGNSNTNIVEKSKSINTFFNENYSLLFSKNNKEKYLLDYDNNTNELYVGEGEFLNTKIGLNSKRLVSNTEEAIQFLVSTHDTKKVWLEGGLDAYYGNRTSQTYTDILGESDTDLKTSSSSKPYYLKVGSIGDTVISGDQTLSLESGNELNIKIGNTSEVKVVKGEVSIPNLVLPQMARINLSTISKRSQVDNYGPTIIFDNGNTKIPNKVGVEISTLTNFDRSAILSKTNNIYTSFNADENYYYHYTYSLSKKSNGMFDLICKTYRENSSSSKVDFTNPIYTTTVVSGITADIKKDQIFAISGVNDTYVLVLEGITGVFNKTVGAISIYKSKNRGQLFSKVNSVIVSNKDYINDVVKVSASCYSSDIVNCGIQDKLAILVQKSYDTTYINATCEYSISVFDSNTERFYTDCLNKKYTVSLGWRTTKTAYEELTSRTASISIEGDYVYFISSHLKNSKYNGTITRISYLTDSSDKTLTLTPKVFNFTSLETSYFNMFLVNTLTVATVGTNTIASTIFTQHLMDGTVDNNTSRRNVGFNFIINSDFTTIDVHHTNANNTNSYDVYVLTESGYYLNENVGYISNTSSSSKVVNVVLYKKSSSLSTVKYLQVYTSNYSQASSYQAYNVLNSKIYNSVAYIIPINLHNFAIYLYDKVVFCYNANYGNVDYSDLITSTNTTKINISFNNPYASSFSSSYVDNLGAIGSTGVVSYILSNKKSKEIKYEIVSRSLDNNNIYESILDIYESGVLKNTVSVSDNGDLNELFSDITYNLNTTNNNYYNKTELKNYVKYISKVDNKEVSFKNLKNISIPVAVTSCGSSMSIDRRSGTIINNNSTISVNSQNAMKKYAVPVEAMSIFTKKAYRSDLTIVQRDDFVIDFNTPGINPVNGIVFAYLRHNNDNFISNSGHSEKILIENDLTKYSFNSSDVGGYYTNNQLILAYDVINNRTFAWNPSSIYNNDLLFDSEDNTMWNNAAGILVSVDSALLNTYDDNFSNYISIVNEKANVVSLRVDYINTLAFQSINGMENGKLIAGFTEINNQDEDC